MTRIVAHSSEKINTRMLLYIYFKTVPPPSCKNAKLASNCLFVFSWKSIYWKRWSDFNGAIRIICWMLQNYVRYLTQVFSQIFISEFSSPSSRKNGWFYNTWLFCFLIKNNENKRTNLSYSDYVYLILQKGLFLNRKCLF